MKTTLYIKSNGLKGQNLFNLVTSKLTNHRDNNLDDFNQRVATSDVQLVIDGEDWNWETNVNGQLTGMNKVW